MQAIVISKPGGYEKLEFRELPDPVDIGSNDALVAVTYIGVNYADCLVRLGLYKAARDFGEYPLVPGFDFSGTVVRVGGAVQHVKVGDRVFGATRFGAYQSLIQTDAQYLMLVPRNVSMSEAASLPTAFLTAYHILVHSARVLKGERVLVRSMAGGVGSWLGILAKYLGAEVHGTVSTEEKRRLLNTRGYMNVYINTSECTDVQFDVIANAYGGATIRQDIAALRPCGRLVLYGFHGMVRTTKNGTLSLHSWRTIVWQYLRMCNLHPFVLVNGNKSIHGINLAYLFDDLESYRVAMEVLIELLKEGVAIPQITEYSFSEVGRAHKDLEGGLSVGKIVLRIDE